MADQTRSECLPNTLKEMVEAAQKYNVTLSVMRAPTDLRLEMPAFHHPFAKNKKLHTHSNMMQCLQINHGVKTIGDLVKMSDGVGLEVADAGLHGKHKDKKCREKAKELLNRVKHHWHPKGETPQRHDPVAYAQKDQEEWGTDPLKALVLYNPDTRTKHSLLGGIRIFGRIAGHKSRRLDPFQRDKDPARINSIINHGGGLATISTDGSAVHNGWENATQG